MNEMFEIKDISYDLRDSHILFQPTCWNTTYVKQHSSSVVHISRTRFRIILRIAQLLIILGKLLLKAWEGHKCQSTMYNAI